MIVIDAQLLFNSEIQHMLSMTVCTQGGYVLVTSNTCGVQVLWVLRPSFALTVLLRGGSHAVHRVL